VISGIKLGTVKIIHANSRIFSSKGIVKQKKFSVIFVNFAFISISYADQLKYGFDPAFEQQNFFQNVQKNLLNDICKIGCAGTPHTSGTTGSNLKFWIERSFPINSSPAGLKMTQELENSSFQADTFPGPDFKRFFIFC